MKQEGDAENLRVGTLVKPLIMKNTKKIFLGALLSMFVLSLGAQTGAGKILLGGSSSFSFGAYTNKYKSDLGDGTAGKGISMSFAPQAGFFVMDGLAVGLQLNLMLDSYKPDGANDRYNNTLMMAGPFVKYYYGTSQLKPFAEAAVAFGANKEKWPTSGGTETFTTNIFGFGFGVGAAYFINDNVSFDLGLSFQNVSYKDKDSNPENEKDITSTFGLDFGISIVL